MEDILSYKGFDVISCLDLNENEMHEAFGQFCNSICEGDDVIFFFAGHAIEYRDTNYLFSIDYLSEFDKETSLTIDKIQNKLFDKNKNGLKLIIIDACRNNPLLDESPIPEKSLANNNTLIAFSTSSGNKAKDGKGENSLYTFHLVESIKEYGLTLSNIFSRTRESVMNATSFSQIPWEYGSILESNSFTFDNILVPNKLKRIIRSRFNFSYSTTFFKDYFYVAGDSNNLDVINIDSSVAEKLHIELVDTDGGIEKIASNNNVIAFISDAGQFGAINFQTQEITSCDFNESLFSVSINDKDVAVIGGVFDELKVIDINSKCISGIDLNTKVLRALYSDEEQIKHAASKLNIMTTCFSRTNENIFAFGGSHRIFGLYDLESEDFLYVNDKSIFVYTYCIDFSNDGKYIVSSHESGKVILWCALSYNIIHCFTINENVSKNEFFEFKEEVHCNHMHHVRFSPNSKFFAVSSSESEVIFFDIMNKTMIDKISLNIEPLNIYSFEFTSKGEDMVVSMGNKHYLLTSSDQ